MVNGTRLYHERRGSGPALVFIPGGLVDSAHFTEVADLLSADFTVITYDRRGSAASPPPPGWHSTTIGEQADDVAGLIDGLGLGPCAVWGGSLGGLILLELLARRPGLVRAAIIHEPPLFSVLDNGPKMAIGLATMAAAAVRDGTTGPAMEQHARQALGEVFDRLTGEQRDRMRANAQTFFDLEVPGLVRSLPAQETVHAILDRVDLPIAFLAGPDPTPPHQAARRLAEYQGAELRELPGGHMPYAIEPAATAQALRDLLTADRTS